MTNTRENTSSLPCLHTPFLTTSLFTWPDLSFGLPFFPIPFQSSHFLTSVSAHPGLLLSGLLHLEDLAETDQWLCSETVLLKSAPKGTWGVVLPAQAVLSSHLCFSAKMETGNTVYLDACALQFLSCHL